ncbi:MAG TPA: MerR family transcriptional regulator [Candidatus Omnitrophota bacterium]|nr:MerR family transcriptional regulator [Candidatus Omnitrophota bacterium]
MKSYLTIKDVAAVLGVSARTLMNWEKAKKIPQAKRDPMNNYRYYTQEDLKKIKAITGRPL